jgi:hypothetical protein
MIKLPPPVWLFIFAAVAGVISALAPWRSIVDLRLVPLGVVLFVLGFVFPAWAFTLFRHEGTEIDPTSDTNKKLVMTGSDRVGQTSNAPFGWNSLSRDWFQSMASRSSK